MFKQVKTDFNFDRHVIGLMTDMPFFAEVSRHIKKFPTNDIPTAAVAFNPKTEDIVMVYNPDFVKKLGNLAIRGLIHHEFYHVIFGHLNIRRMNPPLLWNIATDCAINSLIVDASNKRGGIPQGLIVSKDDTPLPPGGIIPGEWCTNPDGRPLTEEEKKRAQLAQIIAKLPKLKASEWYFHKIKEEAEKKIKQNGKGNPECKKKGEGGQGAGSPGEGEEQPGEGEGEGGFGTSLEDLLGQGPGGFDNHDFWDKIPEDQRPLVEGKIRDIVEKAVRKADSKADGWGNMPGELIEDIRKSVSRIVNWRSVLRQFHGTLIRGKRRTSIKRINRRYPYIHPGVAKGYQARLLIAIDQSGSVDDGMLEMFFAELRTLNKKVTIDILPFDCDADVEDVYTWQRGACPTSKRTRMGGTNFDAPTNVVNDVKNRGKWDGMLIMTDGEAPAPVGSRVKRGWILGQGQNMMFETPELVIKLDDGKPKGGAWR